MGTVIQLRGIIGVSGKIYYQCRYRLTADNEFKKLQKDIIEEINVERIQK